MKAYQFTKWQKKAEIRDVPVPEPKAGEVLIKVGGSGACHSDLHVMEWPEGQLPWKLPFTLGHETAGWVEKLGAGATGFDKGDAVLVYGPWGCGHCKPCRLGRENYCDAAATLPSSGGGLGTDGGHAEFMIVPSTRLLVPLGDLEPAYAAPLADAALTPYHAITHVRDRLTPDSSVLVIGAGGLGHMAIELLHQTTGVRIIATDLSADKLEIAKSSGADEVILSGEKTAEQVRELTHGAGVQAVFDVVGADSTMQLGAASLKAEGVLTIIGLAMGTYGVNFFTVPYGATVRTTYWGTAPELMEIVELAQARKIKARVQKFPLDQVGEVYDKLAKGEIDGRAVIVP